jgi:hypothetical protein
VACVREERGEKEKKKRKEKKEEKDRGHVASYDLVENDDEIFLSQLGNDTWQREITLFLKPQL